MSMPHRINEGDVYGKLTVIRRLSKTERPSNFVCQAVLCRCECGKTTIARGPLLKNGTKQSCGCLKKFDSGIAARNDLRSIYKNRAIKKGLEWSLTDEEFDSFAQGNCHFCGNSPSLLHPATIKGFNGQYRYNGIDRVDNNLGYSSGNSVSCCNVCNMAKRTMSGDEFIVWILRAAKHLSATATQSGVR